MGPIGRIGPLPRRRPQQEYQEPMNSSHDNGKKQVRIDLRSGGWLLLLAGVLVLAFLGRTLYLLHRHGADPYAAPMRSADEYGFDLSTCLVPRGQIVPATSPDALSPLDEPAVVPAGEVPAINKEYHKYLVPGDRVIGVVIEGQARAYPLRVLNWHEVCNDTLAGMPIAVTYSPLCDSAVVFDRRIGGREARFAASGLLYNSNLLMYDRQPAGGQKESLWSQLQFRAVAGPAAADGATLRIMPMQVVYWQDWQRQHPTTTVVAPTREMIDRYRREPYGNYFGSQTLRYPVAPLPTDGRWAYKTDVVAIEVEKRYRVYPLPQIAGRVDPQGHWQVNEDGLELRFDYRQMSPNPPTVWVCTAGGEPIRLVQAFWFAWHAMHPQETVAGSAR